jgi:hypothetical protein
MSRFFEVRGDFGDFILVVKVLMDRGLRGGWILRGDVAGGK